MKTRLLTIEEFGDAFQARVLPTWLASQIRLKGQWLKRSGFPAGSLAKVTLVSPGAGDSEAAAALGRGRCGCDQEKKQNFHDGSKLFLRGGFDELFQVSQPF